MFLRHFVVWKLEWRRVLSLRLGLRHTGAVQDSGNSDWIWGERGLIFGEYLAATELHDSRILGID